MNENQKQHSIKKSNPTNVIHLQKYKKPTPVRAKMSSQI